MLVTAPSYSLSYLLVMTSMLLSHDFTPKDSVLTGDSRPHERNASSDGSPSTEGASISIVVH